MQHPFNGRLSGTTQVSWYQKDEPNLYLLEQERVAMVSAGLYANLHLTQIDNHAVTPPLKFYTGLIPFLPPNQPTVSTHRRQNSTMSKMSKYF